MNQITDGVINHLKPDFLEGKVKWTLGSFTTKLVQLMDFQLSYFKAILKYHPKRWYFTQYTTKSPPDKKGNAKECSNNCTIALISPASKVMLKIQVSRQRYMNQELLDVQAGVRKPRGTRDQIANIHWIIEKAKEFQKNICFIDYTKAFEWITTNCGKFLKRWEYQTTWPTSWEICMWVKKQHLELYMNNRLVPYQERSTSSLYTVTLLI